MMLPKSLLSINILPFTSFPAHLNMGIDEALFLNCGEAKTCFLRFYTWEAPCFSFGYFQKFPEKSRKNRPCVRRMTGGGTVLHDKDLTFSFCGPTGKPFENARAIYSFFGHLVMKALMPFFSEKSLNLSEGEKSKIKNYNCFDKPVSADILYKNKKIYGGALRKQKNSFLFQGTIQNTWVSNNKEAVIARMTDIIKEKDPFITEKKMPQEIFEKGKSLSKSKYSRDSWNFPQKRPTEKRKGNS